MGHLVAKLNELQTQLPEKDKEKYEHYRHWTTTWYAAMQGDHQLDNIFEEYTEIFIDLNKDGLTKEQNYDNTGLKKINGPPCVVLPYYDVQELNGNYTYWYEIVSMNLRALATSVKPDDISIASTKKRSLTLDDPEEKSEEDLEQGENTELNINSTDLENDGDYTVGEIPSDQGDTCIPKITDFIFLRNNSNKNKKFFIKGELK